MTKDLSSIKIEKPLEAELEVEEAAPVVTPEQAKDLIPLEGRVLSEQEAKAVSYVDALLALDPHDPAFAEKVEDIYTVGEQEIKAAGLASSRLLDRPMAERKTESPQHKVATTLGELRTQIVELDPNRSDRKGLKKVLNFFPGANAVEKYLQKYASARDHLEAITDALTTGQDNLKRDNAELQVLQQSMFETMTQLSAYDTLLENLDTVVTKKMEEAAGDAELVKVLDTQVLFAVRQRRTDVKTQMAVGLQGFLAIDMVRKNNMELIRGVERAKSTTMAAMQTAIVVAQALDMQELVLGQVNRLNDTTGEMLASTSKRLKDQGAAIQKQASSSMIQVEKLQEAFNNVFDAMDQIDSFRSKANDNMNQTINAMELQINEAKKRLKDDEAQALGGVKGRPAALEGRRTTGLELGK